jgi:hypothetical protein
MNLQLTVHPVVMILRVCAVYPGSRTIPFFLGTVFVMHVVAQGFGLSQGIRQSASILVCLLCDSILPATQPPISHGCVLVGRSDLYAAVWIAPLVTDTCVLFLTLWQARNYVDERSIMP